MTKKSADINYISKDLFPKTYNRTMIDDDYIKQLEQENKKLNGTIQTYDILLKANVEENKQLKDNWNDLKKYVKEVISTDNELYGTDLLDKIQELEKGKNNEKISKITG